MFLGSVLVLLALLTDVGQSQTACQCQEMNNCLSQHEQQLLLAAGHCRTQCQISLGPSYATAAVQCFADKDTQLNQIKNTIRNCVEARSGQPCVGATATTPTTPEESEKVNRHKRMVVPQMPPVLVLPQNVRDFILCYSNCQQQAFALSLINSRYQGGVYGYPGCARMMNCALVRPTNFTAGMAAQVDCTMQASVQTQSVYQRFCQCLKAALGPEGQFLNCDVYGTHSPDNNSTSEGENAEKRKFLIKH